VIFEPLKLNVILKDHYNRLHHTQGSDKVLQKECPEFLPIFKAFVPERCLALGTFFPEFLAKLTIKYILQSYIMP